MEVSFDKGETWELANLRQIEQPTEYGRYWCWVFWDLDVPVSMLAEAEELQCRGWDESQNTQPDKLTWNLMGMMNNSTFKVKVHPCKTLRRKKAVRFEQPTQPGATPGGWMVPKDSAEPAEAVVPAASAGAAPRDPSKTYYTWEEIEKHDSKESCWFVVDGKVYDSTSYNNDHPGGATSILLTAGQDATEEFMAIHSVKAKKLLQNYYIGEVDTGAVARAAPVEAAAAPAAGGKLVTLDGKKKVSLTLVEKRSISPDTVILRFGLPSPAHKLGLPVGKHMFVYAKNAAGESVIRAYTPITADNVEGYVDLLIKVYRPCAQFPEGGKMSQALDDISIGGSIQVKGPIGHFHYLGSGVYTDHERMVICGRINMIAGGTGITPMWQVLSDILADPNDTTEVKLLFTNRNKEDILLHEELDELAAKHSNLTVQYTLTGACPEDWSHSRGRINEEMMRSFLFPAGDNTPCLMCGPDPLLDVVCKPNLLKMGFTEDNLVVF